MATLTISCIKLGTITIPNNYSTQGNFSVSGNYADYNVTSPESLYKVASTYKWVDRNGKRIKGCSYTPKMAQNDFAKHSK